jgi:N-methylhydantoinase B/oxoprolinase/acetone carboxylase alpha subunit
MPRHSRVGAFGSIVAAFWRKDARAKVNNRLFGDAHRQYDEGMCGGVGAGPGFDAAAAVQTPMTHAGMTDPETAELCHPLRVERRAMTDRR